MRFIRIIILFIGLGVASGACANETPDVDSIMNQVRHFAASYSGVIQSYEASVYLKTNVETKKKNILYKYTNEIPNFVIHDPQNDKAIIESVSKLRYSAPNSFSQDIQYVTGTLTHKRDIALLPFRFVSMDIYSESAHGELFYLPLRKKSAGYYTFALEQVDYAWSGSVYTIRFTPKFKHPQLISGYFTVEDEMWRVLSMHGEGTDFFVDFSFDVVMGQDIRTKYLPVEFRINQTYDYLGNKVINDFEAKMNYGDISYRIRELEQKNYNLGNRFKMRLDSVPLNNDSVLWEQLRTIPLRKEERELLEAHQTKMKAREEQTLLGVKRSRSGGDNTLKMMKNMVANSNYRFKSGDVRFSGLLNPSMLGYSTHDGLSYRQRFAINFNLPRQQRINTALSAGYIFGRNQLSYSIRSRWNYEPDKMGYLSISAGRGNPTLSSKILEDFADSLDFVKDRQLKYYKDHYIKLYNNIELMNGLQFGAGIDYHIREANKRKSDNGVDPDQEVLFPVQYNFVPHVSLSWTPAQYYVQDRNQKVYLRSDYPTFKLEFAQSIPGVWGAEASFNKIEFDINQQINFGLMSSLNYHAGFGFFMNQKNEYFNDFTYFAKSYFPDSWGDGIGGGFTVLPRRYYNAASQYAQAHLMYETSKFALTRVQAVSRFLLRERLYLSQLYTPYMKSYTEVGYGVGNRYVNAAFFIGFHKLSFMDVGARAVFLL